VNRIRSGIAITGTLRRVSNEGASIAVGATRIRNFGATLSRRSWDGCSRARQVVTGRNCGVRHNVQCCAEEEVGRPNMAGQVSTGNSAPLPSRACRNSSRKRFFFSEEGPRSPIIPTYTLSKRTGNGARHGTHASFGVLGTLRGTPVPPDIPAARLPQPNSAARSGLPRIGPHSRRSISPAEPCWSQAAHSALSRYLMRSLRCRAECKGFGIRL
jgi:hypothetical protein